MTEKEKRLNRKKKPLSRTKTNTSKYISSEFSTNKTKRKFTPFYDIRYFIKNYELKTDIKIGVSIIAGISLLLVIIFSTYHQLIGADISKLMTYVESRDYINADEQYSKMMKKRSNVLDSYIKKIVSNKLTKVFTDSGEEYMYKNSGKEKFIGTTNTINSLPSVTINREKVISQANNVLNSYQGNKIDYEEASTYLSVASTLNGVGPEINNLKLSVDEIKQSRIIFSQAEKAMSQRKYYAAIKKYEKVIKDDIENYQKTSVRKSDILKLMPEHYLNQAKIFAKEKDYKSALECLQYILEYDKNNEEAVALKNEYKKH